jgi:hypothetical protein
MPSRILIERNALRAIRMMLLPAVLLVWMVAAGPASAAPGNSIKGGGTTGASGETRFALAITNGTGHFECLMPALMTVEATVTGVDSISSTAAAFHGTAQVTLPANNPFGLPAGPMVTDAPFTASVVAGGPGVGFEDLEILGMSFPGTVAHGQIRVTP